MEYQAGENADLIEHANAESEQAVIVQPQAETESGQEPEAEVVSLPNIEDMTDEEFEEYIASAKDGEVQAEAAADSRSVAEVEQEKTPAIEQNQSEDTKKPFMQFATQEELQQYQDKTIGKRIAQMREKYAPYKERSDRLAEIARSFYGTEDAEAAVENLMNDLTEQNANKAGQTLEQYERNLRLERDAKAYRDQQKQQEETERIQQEWTRQTERLKQIVPEFDMKTALENPDFYQKVVQEGYSLIEAYMLTNRKAEKANVQTAPPRVRRAIQEVGAQKNGIGGNIKQDVKSMSDQQFDDYIRQIQEG